MNSIQEHAIHLHGKYGWNIVPMYYFSRDKATGEKHVKLPDWKKYKAETYPLDKWDETYKALAIITGKISNLTVLDIDSQEGIDTLMDHLHVDKVCDLAEYVVRTHKGYQLFFTYEPDSTTRIGIKDKMDFLSGGITFAADINESYEVLKDNQPTPMPENLKELILDNDFEEEPESISLFEQALRENSDLPYKYPLHPLIKDFLDASRIGKRLRSDLEKVFCTKQYSDHSLRDFEKEGQKHASIMYVAGIVASNPTISENIYIEFLHKWSKEVAKIDMSIPKEQTLLTNRIKGGMKYFRYDKGWKTKADELANPVIKLGEGGFDAWFNPDTELYSFYDHTSKEKKDVSRPSIKEMIARAFNDEKEKAGEDGSYKAKDIDTVKLPEKTETFDPTVDANFFTDEHGKGVYNNFKRSPMLKYFQTCTPKTEMPDFLGKVIKHIYPKANEREMFLHTLAYHMTYLQVSPTCYILTGKSGTGKNIIMQQVLKEIYGKMFLGTTATSLTGRFRSQLKDKLLVFIDEVNEKRHKETAQGSFHNVIKQVVSNKSLEIEAKGKDTQTYPNHALFTMASNQDTPLRLEEGFDRRINITKTNDENLQTLSWFPHHLTREERDQLIIAETTQFVEYLASIELDKSKWDATLDNDQRRSLITSSVPLVQQYTDAIIDQDFDTLHDLDIGFAEWFETQKNKAAVSTSELKLALGDVGNRVIKQLQVEGVNKKKVNNKWCLVVNPTGETNDFDKLKEEF